jgi:hypothetical protein
MAEGKGHRPGRADRIAPGLITPAIIPEVLVQLPVPSWMLTYPVLMDELFEVRTALTVIAKVSPTS